MIEFEEEARAHGFQHIAGVDEAGRGPLAGPVVAAAVILSPSYMEEAVHGELCQLTDSKKLTEKQREHFFEILSTSPYVQTGIGKAEVKEIDEINILRATHKAMARALKQLSPIPDHALIDGLDVPGLPCSSTAIVKGDAKSLSIAAASVLAKVTRDRMMLKLDRQYPVYGFAKHKGYGTAAHVAALRTYGPCPCHRQSFRPVRESKGLPAQRELFE